MCVDRMERQWPHLRVMARIAPDATVVRADAAFLDRVLTNILDNAAKYSPAGSTISIRAEQSGNTVRLQIVDEGEGIPEQDIEKIFDKFYRVRKGDRVRAGTGLGLPICRGFVEAMGGTMAAANRPDRSGAVITLNLPVPTDSPHLEEAL